LKFLNYVWHFDPVTRPAIEAARLANGLRIPVIHLRHTREISELLIALPFHAQSAQYLER
jgi:hypothetical protein